jgi:hypothetical protein
LDEFISFTIAPPSSRSFFENVLKVIEIKIFIIYSCRQFWFPAHEVAGLFPRALTTQKFADERNLSKLYDVIFFDLR